MPEQKTANPTIEKAMERFRLAAEAESQFRAECLEDLKFSTGEQWDTTALTIRKNKPCLTMDQIQQSIRLVCNQYRQKPPAITISPIGDGADQDTADILQGIVRHIENLSEGTVVYEKTHEGIVRSGFDSFRILSDYKDEDGDEQEIYIEKIRNPFSVYWEPGVRQEKATWCFIITDIKNAKYKEDYSDSSLASLGDWTSIGNSPEGWMTNEYVRVAEYYTIEEVDQGKGKRPKKKVKWQKINAIEILEEEDVPGSSIPVFTAYGDDIEVDGKRHVAGLVRNAKDPQRMYNYNCSAATEAVALTPKAPWLAVEGSISNPLQWESANINNVSVLYYKQIDVAGKPAPPPARQTVEPPIQALMLMIRQAAMDTKAAMGIYDPSLGQRKGDESGAAIEKLQAQGSIATMNYADNVARVLRRLGKCLLEWIPVIYDTPRVQRIVNPDGTVKHVITHNGPDQAGAAQGLMTDQIQKIYDIGVGKYDVVVSADRSYQTKRQEAVETQLALLKVLPPQVASTLLDLAVANMDIPQSQEMSKRLKKQLPPNLQDDDQNSPEAQVQKLQAQLQQMTQQHDLLTKALQDTTDIIKTKKVEQDGKTSIAQMQEMSKQEIVKMQEATKLAVAQINASKDANQAFAERELEQYKLLHQSAHDLAMQKDAQGHEQTLATQQQSADQQAQQSDQTHEQVTQATDQAHEQQMAEQQQEEPANA